MPCPKAGVSTWVRPSLPIVLLSTEGSSANSHLILGNLPYRANPYDIENLLAANGFEQIESVHISVDPVSARNPGYCFVDFPDKATADRALASLSAEIDGRYVKVGPCEPKKQSNRRFNGESDYAFQRWGDWNSRSRNNDNDTGSRTHGQGIEQGPTGALNHFDSIVEDQKGRRMFVGGLPKMINQAQHNSEIAELFAAVGFNPCVEFFLSHAAMIIV